ncbi:unnamed protein product, partial [Prorocentrum cordatum]
ATEKANHDLSVAINRTAEEAAANLTQLKQQLAAQMHAEQLEKANVTAAAAAEAEALRKTKRERLNLLEQIAALQSEVRQEQTAVASAKREGARAAAEADKKVQAQR